MGNIGFPELLMTLVAMLLLWSIPIALVVWAVRTLSAIRRTQAEILARLIMLESLQRTE